MTTKLEIISSALVLVGDKPLNSLTEDRRAAVVAQTIYASIFEAEITKHRWGFARTIIPLNQLAQPPADNRYRYAYQMPSDLLVAVQLIPNEYQYIRYGYLIYSNQPQVQLDYIRKTPEVECPAYFIRAFEYALARDLSIAIRDETDRFNAMDIRYKEESRNARFQDSQEFPQQPLTDSPFVTPRF